jgi:hypothetical protein
MNYFEYHGAAFYDDERLNILKSATFCEDIMKITQYEPLDKSAPNYYTGEFVSREITNSWHLIYQNRLYHFLIDMYGRISSFFVLGNKEEFLKGEHGCYYEFENIN